MKDRRKHPRLEINTDIKDTNGEVIFKVLNISKHGIYLKAKQQYELFAILTFGIILKNQSFDIRGIIVRIDRTNDNEFPYNLALFFPFRNEAFYNIIDEMLNDKNLAPNI